MKVRRLLFVCALVLIAGSWTLALLSRRHQPAHIPRLPSVVEEPMTNSETCRQLELHHEFAGKGRSVELCYNERTCRGYFRITTQNCEKARRKLSRNAQLEAYMLQDLGPDVFRLHLDGPEAHAAMSRRADPNRCVFIITIPEVARGGVYRVGLEWLYTDYHALDELSDMWPRLLKAPLLPLDTSFATNYHLQQMTLPSVLHLRCGLAPVQSEGGPAATSEATPLCTGLENVTNGSWVRTSDLEDSPLVFTRVRVRKIQKQPILFEWALQGELPSTWQPKSCTMLSDDSLLRDVALHRKRILVGGDSQLRALYFGLVNVLEGFAMECVRNVSDLAGEPAHCHPNVKGSHRKRITANGRDIQVDFVDDLFLDRFGSGRYSGYDVVIIGFAQHPASKEHWSYDRYRGTLIPKLDKCQEMLKKGKLVVWYLTPQYPHTRVGYPVVVKDWRTDPRLLLFNTLAKMEALRRGVPVVDGFSITTAMSHTSPDQAHFTNWVSYELVRAVLTVVMTNVSQVQARVKV